MNEIECKRKVDIALKHLNKAADLLVEVKKMSSYDCPILALRYSIFCPDEIEVQIYTGLTKDFDEKAKREKYTDMFDQLVLRKGNLKFFKLVEAEK